MMARMKSEESKATKASSSSSNKVICPRMKTIAVYRYNPETPEKKPHVQKYTIDLNRPIEVKRKEKELRIYPLPHMYVLRDLITDQSHFFEQYVKAQPWLQRELTQREAAINARHAPAQFLQSERDRAKLDGLYECIMCGCCSASCPSYWWHYDKFLGPAVLMQAYRWIIDSRDRAHKKRLKALGDYFSVYRCHTIMNCTNCCPKNLNPGKAIAELKRMLIGHVKKEEPDMDC